MYDQLNDLLSLGLHRVWKRAAVKWTGVGPGDAAIDVCCGSGDIAVRLADAVGPAGRVVGLDFARAQLEVAAGKEKRGRHTWFNALTDAAVGSLAIVSRLLVLWHQAAVLMDDGSTDVVVWESIAVGASSIHFLLRNLVLKIDLQKGRRSPSSAAQCRWPTPRLRR